jgi:hypothetical protein
MRALCAYWQSSGADTRPTLCAAQQAIQAALQAIWGDTSTDATWSRPTFGT